MPDRRYRSRGAGTVPKAPPRPAAPEHRPPVPIAPPQESAGAADLSAGMQGRMESSFGANYTNAPAAAPGAETAAPGTVIPVGTGSAAHASGPIQAAKNDEPLNISENRTLMKTENTWQALRNEGVGNPARFGAYADAAGRIREQGRRERTRPWRSIEDMDYDERVFRTKMLNMPSEKKRRRQQDGKIVRDDFEESLLVVDMLTQMAQQRMEMVNNAREGYAPVLNPTALRAAANDATPAPAPAPAPTPAPAPAPTPAPGPAPAPAPLETGTVPAGNTETTVPATDTTVPAGTTGTTETDTTTPPVSAPAPAHSGQRRHKKKRRHHTATEETPSNGEQEFKEYINAAMPFHEKPEALTAAFTGENRSPEAMVHQLRKDMKRFTSGVKVKDLNSEDTKKAMKAHEKLQSYQKLGQSLSGVINYANTNDPALMQLLKPQGKIMGKFLNKQERLQRAMDNVSRLKSLTAQLEDTPDEGERQRLRAQIEEINARRAQDRKKKKK